MRTILLIGKTGQLGWELQSALVPIGRVITVDRCGMDLCDSGAIRRIIREARPDVIVNATGYTAVDKAESEPDLAMQINAVAPGIMAGTAKEVGALLVHYSTVFVFDGTKNEPYVESDTPRPLNTYGKSKLAGERAIIECGGRYIILRATWTYSDRRTNFPLAILRLATRKKRELKVVDDQIGTPTWARSYAQATAQLLQRTDECRDCTGVYHLSATGETTRYQWARMILEIAQQRSAEGNWAKLCPTTTAEYALPAARPLYTVMDTSKVERVFGVRMSGWDEQFKSFLAGLPAPLYTGIDINYA